MKSAFVDNVIEVVKARGELRVGKTQERWNVMQWND
jgi:hypothetical protein